VHVDGQLVKSWLLGRNLTLSAGAGVPIRGDAGHHLVRFWAVVGGSLGGEAFEGEWLVGRRFPDISRRRGLFFLDLGEQSGLDRGGGPLSLHIVMGERAGLEDDGAQLGGAAATSVVEVHKRKAGPGHRILQGRDRRCRRHAMLTAQVQKSAKKTVAAVSVVITAARPVAVVGKNSSIRSSSCTAFAICASGIGLIAPDPR
jgi:hypothetical protein